MFDRLKDMGQAVGAKVKETFGDPSTSGAPPDDDLAPTTHGLPALDAAAAHSLLGTSTHASLDEVRDAARVRARALYPLAHRDGLASEAARTLERDLEALELLEEALLPLHGAGAAPPAGAPAGTEPRRKRATPRER